MQIIRREGEIADKMDKKAVIKAIRDRIKPSLKDMGFKTKGSHYVRVANGEMVQCFGFQGFSSGTDFTINLGIYPLCDPHCHTLWEYIRIDQILGQGSIWWPYCEESIDIVSNVIIDKLLVVLNQCDSYLGCYNSVESSIVEKRIDGSFFTRHNTNMPDILYYCMREIRLLGLCIRLGKLEKAAICVSNEVISCIQAKEHIKELSDDVAEYKKSFSKEMDERVIELKALQCRIENNDVEDLIDSYKNTEIKNTELLKRYFC